MPSEDSSLARRIGMEIRLLRTEQGLTQRDLAQRCGIAQQNLSKYEQGASVPGLVTLEKILDSLGAEITIRRKPTAEETPYPGVTLSPEEVRAVILRLARMAEET